MRESTWEFDATRARLLGDPLDGRLELTSPAEGLTGIRLGGADWIDARLLGLDWQTPVPIGPDALIERFCRGGDLVAAYGETANHPVRVDAVWRARRPSSRAGLLAAVELIVSVETSLLDALPALAVQSRMEACETLYLRNVATGVFQPISLSANSALSLPSPEGVDCVVLRVHGQRPSYVEMVHPLECPRSELRCPTEHGRVQLTHRLFSQHLEKGVILRSRVRGLWVPRADDLEVAAESFREFAASEPPLGG